MSNSDWPFDDLAVAAHESFNPSNPADADRYLASMVRYFKEDGNEAGARVLLSCQRELRDESDCGWNGLVLRLLGPRRAYEALDERGGFCYAEALDAAQVLIPDGFDSVRIERRMAMLGRQSSAWRQELLAILDGRDVDNQAVAFKATRTWNGLRFRSESEIRIARELEKAGVMFLPTVEHASGLGRFAAISRPTSS